MTSLTILTVLTALGVLWTLRAFHLDAARQRRRADRLAAECRELRADRERLLDELDLNVDTIMRLSRERHPSSQSNVRVLRGVR